MLGKLPEGRVEVKLEGEAGFDGVAHYRFGPRITRMGADGCSPARRSRGRSTQSIARLRLTGAGVFGGLTRTFGEVSNDGSPQEAAGGSRPGGGRLPGCGTARYTGG